MKKYIGIKPPSTESTNLSLIYVKQSDGKYVCINCGRMISPVLSEDQIQHDLNLGFLKEYKK